MLEENDLIEFKSESFELLEDAEASLLDLDNNGDFKVCFDKLFRTFHNLKGSAGMMDLNKVESHTHELETVLMKFKEKDRMSSDYINYFLKGIDATKSLLSGDSISFNYSTDRLDAGKAQDNQDTNTFSEESYFEFITDSEEISERIYLYLNLLEEDINNTEVIDCLYREIHTLKGNSYLFSCTLIGDLTHQMETSLEDVREGTEVCELPLIHCLYKCVSVIESILKEIKTNGDTQKYQALIQLTTKALAILSKKKIREGTTLKKDIKSGQEINKNSTKELSKSINNNGSIRVSLDLLDNLMTLVGEMVLVRNQVLQFADDTDNVHFSKVSKKLSAVTTEIQEEMMKTRMQPIGNLLQKFNRVVRDLSTELNKKMTISFEGSETELDKNLLEAIKDPLTHIIRNSCDHGIETAQERIEKGKSEEGQISIKSYHEGGQVVIEVSDDGKGLSKEFLISKGIEKSIIKEIDVKNLSDKEIFQIIFAPGFSTAEKITNVSGRGVGMDVVKTNIENIGGVVDLISEEGVGTSIKIKIPLTLAIMPSLIVLSAGSTLAIPQVTVSELVRVDSSSQLNTIELIHGKPVFRLRGNIIPLIDLNNLLLANDMPREGYKDLNCNIVIANANNTPFGIIVDSVKDTIDIVVKPVNKLFKSLELYSGATILGDGTVALILDILGLSRKGQIELSTSKPKEESYDQQLLEEKDFLLFKVDSEAVNAIALPYVDRLEKFKSSELEMSDGEYVVRYGGQVLPLIFVREILFKQDIIINKEDIFDTIVIKKAGRLYGLIVEDIIDTLSTSNDLDVPINDNPLIFGNLIMKDRLIVVLNPFEFIDKKFEPKNINNISRELLTSPNEEINHILLVEDTVFFRKTIQQFLENHNYKVTTTNDGQEAWELLQTSKHGIKCIISDIEMPKMNGFKLAQNIRKVPLYQDIPLIALSSKADEKNIQRGLNAGFNIYLEKFKQNELLMAIRSLNVKKNEVA